MHEIISSIFDWSLNMVVNFGYLGLFISMFLQSAIIFIPAEITLPFCGYLVSQGQFTAFGVIAITLAANLAGSLFAYAIGFWGKEKLVRRFIQKYGKWVFLSETDFDKSLSWFQTKGEIITFTSRFIPGVKSLISLSAGISAMKILRFSFYTTLGAFIWSLILFYLGKILGDNWNIIGKYAQKFELLIFILGIFLVIFYFYHKINKNHPKTQV